MTAVRVVARNPPCARSSMRCAFEKMLKKCIVLRARARLTRRRKCIVCLPAQEEEEAAAKREAATAAESEEAARAKALEARRCYLSPS